MKPSAITFELLFGIISQTSAAIIRVAEPSTSLKGAFHGSSALGDSPSLVTWSSSLTEMQERIAQGQRLASLPPPKILESPLSAKNEESLVGSEDSLGRSEASFEPVQGLVLPNQHLDVESEQYKIMKLADRKSVV